jgi:hypothetical protein
MDTLRFTDEFVVGDVICVRHLLRMMMMYEE